MTQTVKGCGRGEWGRPLSTTRPQRNGPPPLRGVRVARGKESHIAARKFLLVGGWRVGVLGMGGGTKGALSERLI